MRRVQWGLVVAALILNLAAVGARAEEEKSKDAKSEEKPAAAAIQASDKEAIAAAKDKESTVEGTVSKAAWSSTGKVMVINFKGAEESRFSAVVFERNKAAVDKAFDGDVTKAVAGAKIRVKGKVGEFRGSPQIVINKPEQLTIVEKGAAEGEESKDSKEKKDGGEQQ